MTKQIYVVVDRYEETKLGADGPDPLQAFETKGEALAFQALKENEDFLAMLEIWTIPMAE